jgi:hypothetical protein
MPFPVLLPAGAARPALRTPADITLGVVFAELTAARSANQLDRGTARAVPAAGGRPDRLLTSLEACAAALAERQLPIPPSLRDELRLRRRLWSERR